MRKVLYILICLVAVSVSASAQKTLVPKGEMIAGASFAGVHLDADNSEYLLMINNMDASISHFTASVFAGYTIADDRMLGLKLGLSSFDADLAKMKIDLMGDALSFDLSGVKAGSANRHASLFYRRYIPLGEKGIVGLFYDCTLTGTTARYTADGGKSTARKLKGRLSFDPGVVFFALKNISTSLSVSMADISYTNVKYRKQDADSGSRSAFNASLTPDLLGMNFSIAVHF